MIFLEIYSDMGEHELWLIWAIDVVEETQTVREDDKDYHALEAIDVETKDPEDHTNLSQSYTQKAPPSSEDEMLNHESKAIPFLLYQAAIFHAG